MPLKVVRVVSHGSAGTTCFPGGIGNSSNEKFQGSGLSDVATLSEFARLRPYLTRNAKIRFHGCEVAARSLEVSATVTILKVVLAEDLALELVWAFLFLA